ncbi:Conserved_hypothetical protein [Hexamita inflata]|uniref:Condensation domain-containing protein n=1 Tax=Hexamita inflata TaxID=28002 RepID=A0AA86PBE9_9EUKA|nr:Conserved hypothetical protein [Hexamita inflata]CAI9940813.1 Conserved hypothetical protein [Hexamita inflata]
MPISNFQELCDVPLNKMYNTREYRLDKERRPLTSCQMAINGQDNVISIGCFIEDPNFNIQLAQKTWDLIFEQYPFMTSKIVFNAAEKWQFFEPQPEYRPALPQNLYIVTSQKQLDETLNTTQASDSKLVHIDLYKMKVEGLPFRFLMMFQVAHSISDGSTTTFLLQRFNKYYTQLQRGEEVKLDFVQKGPFTMVSAYPEDADIGPSTSSNYKGLTLTPVKAFSEIEPKIQYHKYHIRFQKKSEFSFKKFKGATVSHSMYATQIIMQCAFMYYTKQLKEDETAQQLVSDLIRDYDFLNQHGYYKQNFEDIFGYTIVGYPMTVNVAFDSNVGDILTQIQSVMNNFKNMDPHEHMKSLIASDNVWIPKISFKYPISVYGANLGRFENESPIRAFSLASIQLNHTANPGVCNFTAVTTDEYVCFNQQNLDGFSDSDYDKFFDLFKAIQLQVYSSGSNSLRVSEVVEMIRKAFATAQQQSTEQKQQDRQNQINLQSIIPQSKQKLQVRVYHYNKNKK